MAWLCLDRNALEWVTVQGHRMRINRLLRVFRDASILTRRAAA